MVRHGDGESQVNVEIPPHVPTNIERSRHCAEMSPVWLEACRDRHKGQPGFVICTGESIENFDLSRLYGRVTVGVNASFYLHSATYHTALDGTWFKNEPFLKAMESYFEDRLFTTHQRPHGVQIKPSRRGRWSWDLLTTGISSRTAGIFALQIAAWLGANPVYVLGMDGISGKKGGHFYPGRPIPEDLAEIQNTFIATFKPEWAEHGLEVFTCAEVSAIDLPYKSFEDALA